MRNGELDLSLKYCEKTYYLLDAEEWGYQWSERFRKDGHYDAF